MTIADPDLEEFILGTSDICSKALKTFAEPFKYIVEIDQLYRDFFAAAVDVNPAVGTLLLNSHASLRTAMKLAFSGQLVPVYIVLRGVLESALYALAIAVNPELELVWMDRHTDIKSRRACIAAFASKTLFLNVEHANNKHFADVLRDMYESMIDFGAHPNPRFILDNTNHRLQENGRLSMEFAYAHGSGSPDMKQTIFACAETGIAIFLVQLLCDTNNRRVTELNERVLALRERLPELVSMLI